MTKTKRRHRNMFSITPVFQCHLSKLIFFLNELWINRKVYKGKKRVVNEFPATYVFREVSEGCGRVERDYLRRSFVLERRGREMGYIEE